MNKGCPSTGAALGQIGAHSLADTRSGGAPTTITVRLTPLNRAICETMSGTNTDYSCHTVDRAAITVRSEEAGTKQIPRLDVIARCADPKVSVSFAQFGRYAAEMLAYAVTGSKESRPSAKCG